MSKELLDLIHQTQVRKYDKSDPRHVLMRMVKEIKHKKHYYNFRCWELMVEHLARSLVLNEHTGLACTPPLQGFKGLNLEKDDVYKHLEGLNLFQHYFTAAKAKPWDYIGDVHIDLELTQAGQNMTPRPVVELMTRMTYSGESEEKMLAELYLFEEYREYLAQYYLTHNTPATHVKPPVENPIKTQLDPCVGTGRFLIVASQMMPKAPLVLFGIEINISLYRACLVNMAMFSNHPYSIICADALRLDPEKSGPSSKIWDGGNRWNPLSVDSFYWKPPPIWHDRFSLKAFTELLARSNP